MNARLILFLSIGIAAHTALAQETGDPVAGAEVFKQCATCHQVGPGAVNAQGPVLNGIVGRPAGTFPGYTYSPQNKNIRVRWDVPTLTRYLKAPKSFVPGTKMFFDGLSSPKDIVDVIAYLNQFDDQGNKKP
jgi:cytochrome c